MVIPGSYREGDIGPWPEPRELQKKMEELEESGCWPLNPIDSNTVICAI